MNKEGISINSVEAAQMEEIVAYVRTARQHLFPSLDHHIIPRDLAAFEETYITDSDGIFLEARDQVGKLIGTIGMLSYDGRFDHLDFQNQHVTEVVKLFVDPSYRRQGLASRMVHALRGIAASRNIEMLYLHTHPFLPGAEDFWTKQGFREIITSVHAGFETIHMACSI